MTEFVVRLEVTEFVVRLEVMEFVVRLEVTEFVVRLEVTEFVVRLEVTEFVVRLEVTEFVVRLEVTEFVISSERSESRNLRVSTSIIILIIHETGSSYSAAFIKTTEKFMDFFSFKKGQAYCERIPLKILAKKVDTPVYVYSSAAISQQCKQFTEAFSSYPTTFCYAVKANSNLSILRQIFSAGFGADIVSQGELERAVLAGVEVKKVVYSGVGKKEGEIKRALELGILAFNVESFFELELISKTASQMKKKAAICLRLNPDIDAKTHPKIATGLHSTKFGIETKQLESFLSFIEKNASLELIGLACHIGSQLTDMEPIADAARKMMQLVSYVKNKGFALRYLNMGGGLGIRYVDERIPQIKEYAKVLLNEIKGLELILEPGRILVGNAGVLLIRVEGIKESSVKKFAIVDAGMNDLLRPTLYGAVHEIDSVEESVSSKKETYDVVGPVCETGDYLGLDVLLPKLKQDDLLFVRSCGAYGFSMASRYNSRPGAAEVLVDGETFRVVRKRESFKDLWALEE